MLHARSYSVCVLFLLAAAFVPAVALPATYYVDNQNPAASDAGPGTLSTPYRTISAAVTQHGGPGNTILVMPGTYREQVTVGASGASGSPLVIEAQGAAIVEGADDFSNSGLWVPLSGDVYLASSVTWDPVQVFADGARLIETALNPAALTPMTFRYVAGTGLYVNAGGGNPGAHGALVGRRTNGFRLPARSYVTIRGFTVSRSEDKGIYALTGSNSFTLENNHITHAGTQGVQLAGSTAGLIAGNEVSYCGDHGIALFGGTTATTVRGNYSHHNARPTVRAANGIFLSGSSDNRIEGNRLTDNQDSGLQMNLSSNNNVSVQNVSWNNGDHGYDHLGSTGNLHVGDVAYGNYRDGFSFEGNAPGGKVYDCIAVNNGLTLAQFDLWVDSASSVGFESDYNLFWNANGQSPIQFVTTIYSTIAAFASATGHDSHSIQADPRFANGPGGDFRLRSGSPAIDAASSNVPQWLATDAEGAPRFDNPTTPNTGVGPVTYADRGAFEFSGEVVTNQPPTVSSPAGVIVNEGSLLTVAVSAFDPDGEAITSLTADFSGLPAGHNAQFVPGPGNTTGTLTWTPTYDHAGSYSVTFIASNSLTGSRATAITVLNTDRAPVVSAPNNVKANAGSLVTFDVTAADADGDAIASLTASLSGLPAGNDATFTVNATHTGGTFRWTPAVGLNGNYTVGFTASNVLSGSASTRVQVRRKALLASAEGAEGLPLELALSAPMPNPSPRAVTFALDLPTDARVAWGVYDVTGRELWSEVSELAAGHRLLRWDGSDRRAGPGLYFLRVRVEGREFTRRFVRM